MAAIEPRSEGPLFRAGREPGSLGSGAQLWAGCGAQLRSARGAGAADVSVLGVEVESVGAVLLSVVFGSAAGTTTPVSAGIPWVVVVELAVADEESVDCATAAPMPASRAAAAATADNFFPD